MEPLINKGIAEIGKRTETTSTSRVVIVGTARGGTSMVAGVLAKLGVFMGYAATAPVYEDLVLSTAFEKKNYTETKKIINEYSEINNIWGWKRPSSIKYLDNVDKLLESPLYIFIYKDIMSIANRNSISMLSDMVTGMEKALSDYQESLDFIKRKNISALIISYDKVMLSPASFINKIIDFCNLTPSQDQIDSALDFISLNPKDYLEKSRITRTKGELEGISKGKIVGWAKFIHQPEKRTAKVNIYLNDNLIAQCDANEKHPAFTSSNEHNYGFSAKIPDTVIVKNGDFLRASVDGDVNDLNNSPLVINKNLPLVHSGRIGGIVNNQIVGWAKQAYETHSKGLLIDIYINNKLLVSTKANKYREDLRNKFSEDCAFSKTLPPGIKLNTGDELAAKVRGSDKWLDNSPFIVKERPLPRIIGRLYGIHKGKIHGWAKVRGTVNFQHLVIDIHVNNSYIGRVTANEFREDLNDRFSVNCAFYLAPPNNVKLKHGDVVTARVVGEPTDIDNSPLTLSFS